MNPNCYSDVFRSEDSSYSRRGEGNFPSPSSSSAMKLKCDIKQQQVEEEEEDIISNLPESLLHHIFSFLDIKHAIHTCVLSRRWRYFWVSIPTLNFVYKPQSIPLLSGEVRPIQIFIDFVNRVLMLRDNSNILRFVFTYRSISSIGDPRQIATNLKTWILIAVLRNVQQLSLEIACEPTYRLPHSLVTCKSLTKLEIHYDGFEFNNWSGFPDKIYLPKLKTLYLDSIHFIDKYLSNRMLPNCPSLESLILHRCSFSSSNLDICSLKLKELTLTNCRPFNIWFNFNVPNLISFRYYNVYVMLTSVLEKKEMYVQRMVHILKKLYNVEDLKLSAPHLEFLTGAPDLLDSSLTQFWNLRCLMLEDICITKDFNRAVSYLLKLSPNIKTLCVGTRWKDCDFKSGCWEAGLSSNSDCLMMNHLTVFELREVFGCDNEVKFIEVLLKNAKVLEKLVITYKKNMSPDKHIRRFSTSKVLFNYYNLVQIILDFVCGNNNDCCRS